MSNLIICVTASTVFFRIAREEENIAHATNGCLAIYSSGFQPVLHWTLVVLCTISGVPQLRYKFDIKGHLLYKNSEGCMALQYYIKVGVHSLCVIRKLVFGHKEFGNHWFIALFPSFKVITS